jgi:hypothetical protein
VEAPGFSEIPQREIFIGTLERLAPNYGVLEIGVSFAATVQGLVHHLVPGKFKFKCRVCEEDILICFGFQRSKYIHARFEVFTAV